MRDGRRGSSAVWVAMSLLIIGGFTALAVDLGVATVARAQVQNGVDAAAHGGAAYLDGTQAGMLAADYRAREIAAQNHSLGVDIAVSSVETGYIDPTGAFVASADLAVVNAIRVSGVRNGIAAPFGALLGIHQLTASARAVGVRPPPEGAGAADCYLPLAIPACVLGNTAFFESQGFEFSSAGQDNIAWAMPGAVNAASVVSQLTAPNNCSSTVSVNDTVNLNNGQIAAAMQAVGLAIESSLQTWNTTRWGPMPAQMPGSSVLPALYGRVIQGPVMLFDDGGVGTCAASTQFTGSRPIVGFVWGAIYDVKATGGNKRIQMKLDLTHVYEGGSGGGGVGNVTYQPPPRITE